MGPQAGAVRITHCCEMGMEWGLGGCFRMEPMLELL